MTIRLSQENTLDINISNNLDAQQTDSQLNNIITLEPYERKRNSEELDSDRKRINGQWNKERKYKQLLTVNDLFNDEIKFPIYYVLTFPVLDIETKLNVIEADAEIKSKIGQVHKISKLNKYAILIQIISENRGRKLMQITSIANQPVTV